MSINEAKWTFTPFVLASSITSFLFLTFVRFHAGIFSYFSHSLSTAALRDFPWLEAWEWICWPNWNAAMNCPLSCNVYGPHDSSVKIFSMRSLVDSMASRIHASIDLISLVLWRVSPCLLFLFVLQGTAGAMDVSIFLRELFMVSFNSLCSGSMKWIIARNFLAWFVLHVTTFASPSAWHSFPFWSRSGPQQEVSHLIELTRWNMIPDSVSNETLRKKTDQIWMKLQNMMILLRHGINIVESFQCPRKLKFDTWICTIEFFQQYNEFLIMSIETDVTICCEFLRNAFDQIMMEKIGSDSELVITVLEWCVLLLWKKFVSFSRFVKLWIFWLQTGRSRCLMICVTFQTSRFDDSLFLDEQREFVRSSLT